MNIFSIQDMGYPLNIPDFCFISACLSESAFSMLALSFSTSSLLSFIHLISDKKSKTVSHQRSVTELHSAALCWSLVRKCFKIDTLKWRVVVHL